MNRYAFLLLVIKKLEEVGSWTGNTHIQKTAGLVQSITGFKPYKFVMHHYGPYSFELRDDLNLLVSAGFVERRTDESGYHYALTSKGLRFLENSEIETKILGTVDEIANLLGRAPTIVLELISTIDYVLNKFGSENEEKVLTTVKMLKPHFSEEVIMVLSKTIYTKNNNQNHG
ncbi:hypothetical protein [Archaeoglobus veneficus]|uniref:DUF4364 family protein n=1 Tax=Archaeoglobus veneficus (strain DSM 11195 / SNP6) TaxID=693661 RepID=F2KP18_ARCVS|nr:hypothetical protein [Archaeoglobus veneficus]AEA46326.1 hypothetical protein Arcve_0291 [Archaeoglobus veneficus SNP6]